VLGNELSWEGAEADGGLVIFCSNMSVKDAREAFEYMKREGIGRRSATVYCAWADLEQKHGKLVEL
jgi:hypothetical protein